VSPMLMDGSEEQPHLDARSLSLRASVSHCSHARRAGHTPCPVANEWVH
jgi:hypothetical protein